MYTYTWYQWLAFFYVYCFLGWIFESTYVSLKQKRLVNRGVLRLPMLPLYYTFYDGPPTANGKPHIGHVLTRVIKDGFRTPALV